jgi:ABC-type maltose transport system permease subunit
MSQTLGVTNYETVIAGALLTAIPGVIIFMGLQRHILQGFNLGGVKG